MKAIVFLTLSALLPATLYGQGDHDFHSVNGSSGPAETALKGWTVADHYGTSDYSGYVGELGLVFEEQVTYASITDSPKGTFRGDAGDDYDDELGLRAFCIDSETSFVGPGTTSIQTYRPYTLAAAEQRYGSDGVVGYTTGGLKRAAYLLEQNFDEMMLGGDLKAATMQAVIWEVLTDTNPNLTTGQGNYYLRNNTGDTTLDQRADDMITLGNSWLSQASTDNWGGASYTSDDSVVFWLDPNSTALNQSVISLNPVLVEITTVPEPSTSLLAILGAFLLFSRRR